MNTNNKEHISVSAETKQELEEQMPSGCDDWDQFMRLVARRLQMDPLPGPWNEWKRE